MAYYDQSNALVRREEAQTRALSRLAGHAETIDLMRAPASPARDLVPWPTRYAVRRSAVANGYIVGSPAERAAEAMGLVPTAVASRPFGQVAFVEGPKVSARERAKRTRAEAETRVRPTADGGRLFVLSDHELMKDLGIMPVGFLE